MRPSPAHERGQPTFEYSRITSRIWIGTNQCCTTHFSHTLRRLGIVADVSLEAEQLDAAYGTEVFLWLPVRDHRAPTPVQLRVGVHALAALVAAGQRVYVHCKNGHGRAPTLVAAYLIASEGLTVAQAVARIRARRPHIHLEPIQLRALERFARATPGVR
ncbi:dual specificity protein phosphatase family protein [Candidatus Uhrbacteria bacterium]|nr:dual specificity protein phosphatase family protein [Candidatus Uhrbacteria bacterium]